MTSECVVRKTNNKHWYQKRTTKTRIVYIKYDHILWHTGELQLGWTMWIYFNECQRKDINEIVVFFSCSPTEKCPLTFSRAVSTPFSSITWSLYPDLWPLSSNEMTPEAPSNTTWVERIMTKEKTMVRLSEVRVLYENTKVISSTKVCNMDKDWEQKNTQCTVSSIIT